MSWIHLEDGLFVVRSDMNTVGIADNPLRLLAESKATPESLKHTNLQTLASELSTPKPTTLVLYCFHKDAWDRFDGDSWQAFVTTLETNLPSINRLCVVGPNKLGDHKLAAILDCMPSSLTSLGLFGMEGELPMTFKQIGLSLRALQQISLVGAYNEPFMTLGGGNVLAKALKALTNLKCIQLLQIGADNETKARTAWKPVFDAIRSNAELMDVSVDDLWWCETGPTGETTKMQFPEEDMAPLQFGPRLNQAKQRYLSGEQPVSVDDLVNALISVHDSVDCLNHLLSQESDPTTYAKQAIGVN